MREFNVVGRILIGEATALLFAIVDLLGAVTDFLSQALGNDEKGKVDSILEDVADDTLAEVDRTVRVALFKEQVECGTDGVSNEAAGVSADGLNTLRVHLVRRVRVRVVHARIPLLIHQQVGVIDFFELELDRLDEQLADFFGRLLTEPHGLGTITRPKQHHDRVSVTVNNIGIVLERLTSFRVNILLAVNFNDARLRRLNHLTAESGDTGGDCKTRQLADLSASEPVHTVSADFQSQLAAVKHRLHKWVFGLFELFLSLLTGRNQLFENNGQNALLEIGFYEKVAVGRPSQVLRLELISRLLVWHVCRVTKVVSHHDRRVQRGEVERRDRPLVEALLRVDDDSTFELLARHVGAARRNNHVVALGFSVQLTGDLDLLAAREQETERYAGDPRHLGQVEQAHQLVEQPQR